MDTTALTTMQTMIPSETLAAEAQLVIQYQETQDSIAFGQLYELFYKPLYEYCRTITGDSADAFDCTQEAFIKAAAHLYTLRQPLTFRFWLFRIGKRICLKRCRERSRSTYTCYDEDTAAQDYSGEEAISRDHQLSLLADLVAALTPEEQYLLTSKYSDGRSIADIMQATHLGSSAIKMKLMRARQKLEKGMAVVA